MSISSAPESEKVGIQPYVCLQAGFIRSLDICARNYLISSPGKGRATFVSELSVTFKLELRSELERAAVAE
jgi:hypothetical protein